MFEQAGKMLKLIYASMEAYFGDFSVSVWYRQYHITVEIFRLFREKVGVKIVVSEKAESVYIREHDDAGVWTQEGKWTLRPSTISKLIEETLGICK